MHCLQHVSIFQAWYGIHCLLVSLAPREPFIKLPARDLLHSHTLLMHGYSHRLHECNLIMPCHPSRISFLTPALLLLAHLSAPLQDGTACQAVICAHLLWRSRGCRQMQCSLSLCWSSPRRHDLPSLCLCPCCAGPEAAGRHGALPASVGLLKDSVA